MSSKVVEYVQVKMRDGGHAIVHPQADVLFYPTRQQGKAYAAAKWGYTVDVVLGHEPNRYLWADINIDHLRVSSITATTPRPKGRRLQAL